MKGKIAEMIQKILEAKAFDAGCTLPESLGVLESLGKLSEYEQAVYTCSVQLSLKLFKERILSGEGAESKVQILEKQCQLLEEFFWLNVLDRLNLWQKAISSFALGIIKGKYVIALEPEVVMRLLPGAIVAVEEREIKSLNDLPEEVREKLVQTMEGLGFYRTNPGSGGFSHN